ncbi:NADPH-dependent FMN reductase [Actinoplanes aureus]|uniref:NAD(P)H-dependent oxidoreductase n=1 Tax=Actinoplanes aureus TaxID=2792083 RepID=A0A931C0R8_9ACTN|nr:NAD(P)H-dependent oxidoreductase [Actinoplanes aureus]MBG0561170.1 NAD(P)H-dependent oxidoreductase [Actinoplanes aureus]
MTETTVTDLPTLPATLPATGGGEPLRIAVVAASVRDQRMGRTLAEWAAFRAATDAEVDLIDCADCVLPGDGELRPGGSSGSPVAARIDAADAFVFVTPEYNHSYPASLKRLIDWHYREWMFKPATVLSYGVQGGLLATEHLRGVFAELHMVTTRRVVGLRTPWDDLGPAGYAPPAAVEQAYDAALHELGWWATVLRSARRDRPFAR